MIYFTADNHFCHGNIIGSCYRPFKNTQEMNDEMIKRWNTYIGSHDEVYILGDFAYKGDPYEVNRILSKLKGKKYLIKGNHDLYLTNHLFNTNAFEWVKDYYVLNYETKIFILFHFPILEWHQSHRSSIHLYGHVHNSEVHHPDFAEKVKMLGPKAINVTVDMNDFYPVSIKEILKKVEKASEEA